MQGPPPRPTPLSQSSFAACVLMFEVQPFYTCCQLGQELLYSSAVSDLCVQMNGKLGRVLPYHEERQAWDASSLGGNGRALSVFSHLIFMRVS